MADLEDTFGEDFAEGIEQTIQERRQERQQVSEETKREIANLAINEGKMHHGDPMFEYSTEEGITHDVLLMQLADPREGTVWNQVNQFENGGFSIPLDYLGEWIYSIFNDESMAKKMEEGEWYVVIGNLDTWEPDEGDPQDQLSPVRGVMSLEETKKFASEYMDDEGFGSEEESTETETEDTTDEDTSSSDDAKGSVFGGGEEDSSDEDEEKEAQSESDNTPAIDASVNEVHNIVEDLAEEEEEVWDVTAGHDELDTFVMVICDRLDLDYDNDEVKKEVAEIALDRVDEGPAEEEEEEDDEEEALFG